ncbi:MAG: hypothetical protein CMH53_08215 [Myxococcales bacterium]|nr:hypothetical protein [Myxococcales bacterium]
MLGGAVLTLAIEGALVEGLRSALLTLGAPAVFEFFRWADGLGLRAHPIRAQQAIAAQILRKEKRVM